MKPRPIRMPDSLWDDLQAEAEADGLDTAEYVRQILRQRGETTTKTVVRRLEKLERRVDDLKAGDREHERGGSAQADATISTGRGARTREEAEREPDPESDAEE